MASLLQFGIYPSKKCIRVQVNRLKRIEKNKKIKYVQESVGSFRLYNDPYYVDEERKQKITHQLTQEEYIELEDFLFVAKVANEVCGGDISKVDKEVIRLPISLKQAITELMVLCDKHQIDFSLQKSFFSHLAKEITKTQKILSKIIGDEVDVLTKHGIRLEKLEKS